ncbi:MAG: fumarate hydratase, partial [Firmicutes bacterium]|nr:fumarate hydratase [Bacillota bacterium]
MLSLLQCNISKEKTMREIAYEKIRDAVADAVIKANIFLPESTCSLLRNARQNETSAIAQEVYGIIEENIAIAAEKHLPLCQDTGTLVCMIKLGQEAHISGGLLRDAVNEGIAAGYEKGYLRKSIVSHPLQRVNTNDNTPAVIHIELCEGDIFEMRLLPKGGGAENMSALKMLPPAAGREGIIDFVLQTVKNAGANPCPPIIVGVGIGGNFEQCAWAAKKALA